MGSDITWFFDKLAPTAAAADVHAPAANTAAVITYTAAAGIEHVIDGIAWSYSGAPTGGNLKVQDGATTVFSMDITAGGHGYIPVRKRGTANTNLVITLAAGGEGVSGKVNVLAHWAET